MSGLLSYGILMTKISSSKLNPMAVYAGYLNSISTWYFCIIHLPFCICSSGQEWAVRYFLFFCFVHFFCWAPW